MFLTFEEVQWSFCCQTQKTFIYPVAVFFFRSEELSAMNFLSAAVELIALKQCIH